MLSQISANSSIKSDITAKLHIDKLQEMLLVFLCHPGPGAMLVILGIHSFFLFLFIFIFFWKHKFIQAYKSLYSGVIIGGMHLNGLWPNLQTSLEFNP